MITRHQVASKLAGYLTHQISLDQLETWAVSAMMDEDFDPQDIDLLSDIISRIGLAKAQAVGLTWEDFESFLSRLGYRIQLQVLPA